MNRYHVLLGLAWEAVSYALSRGWSGLHGEVGDLPSELRVLDRDADGWRTPYQKKAAPQRSGPSTTR